MGIERYQTGSCRRVPVAFTRLYGQVYFYETVDAILFIAMNMHINGRFH